MRRCGRAAHEQDEKERVGRKGHAAVEGSGSYTSNEGDHGWRKESGSGSGSGSGSEDVQASRRHRLAQERFS